MKSLAALALLAVLAFPAGLFAGVPKPVIAAPAKGEKCIAPPEVMRREHMHLLTHQRDETVHGGVRGAKASLQGCIECHASKKSGSVAATKEDFCVSCHSYAAVKIDCFECHATRPKPAARTGAGR